MKFASLLCGAFLALGLAHATAATVTYDYIGSGPQTTGAGAPGTLGASVTLNCDPCTHLNGVYPITDPLYASLFFFGQNAGGTQTGGLGQVEGASFFVFDNGAITHWDVVMQDGLPWALGTCNAIGFIAPDNCPTSNAADFDYINAEASTNFNTPGSWTPLGVPEPASLALLSSGLFGIWWSRRRSD